MKKLKHYLLLWILIMAIPLQGLAATSMMLCASQQHQATSEKTHASAGHQHHSADTAKHQHKQTMDADAQSSDTADKLATHQHTSKDKCSNCAACCVGAVMLTSYLAPHVSRPSSEKIDMVFSSHVGHISDSLERPPRA